MLGNDILAGVSQEWRLLNFIDQGDAGELYSVESIRDGKLAILKRPVQSAFPAEAQRQSNQIEREGRILKALRNFNLSTGHFSVRVANLIDQSPPGTEMSERYFIVLEQASGISLSMLAKHARLGGNGTIETKNGLSMDLQPLLSWVEMEGRLPRLLILRSIQALFNLLDALHTWKVEIFDGEMWGVLWNDIKPDHIFWNPVSAEFTMIDWGNGQFLEKDRISSDRNYSILDDYRQLIEEFGRFLLDLSPELYSELNWAASAFLDSAESPVIRSIKENLQSSLQKETGDLLECRQRESYLLSAGASDVIKLREIVDTHGLIVSFGELPEYPAAENLFLRSAALLASQSKLGHVIHVCQLARNHLPTPGHHWKVLEALATMVTEGNPTTSTLSLQALRSGLDLDWAETHWKIGQVCVQNNDLESWPQLSAQIRNLIPEISKSTHPPHRAALRLLQGLEEDLNYLRVKLETLQTSTVPSTHDAGSEDGIQKLNQLENLLGLFRDDLLQKWVQVDPVPPGADLSYHSLEQFLDQLQAALQNWGMDAVVRLKPLRSALSQPQAQAAILLDTWRAKGYQTARKVLRQLFLWDPDRLRVLRADQSINNAQQWLEETRQGPRKSEKLAEYALRMEHTARQLRSRVGTAAWIETPLDLFTRLRNGEKPGDLLTELPALMEEFPWLKYYERKLSEVKEQPHETKVPPRRTKPAFITGAKDGLLGQSQDISLGEALDVWVPEARGSSARVFSSTLKQRNGKSRQVAMKIMRPDKAEYALPLFWEEVQVLSLVGDLQGVSGWLECGFLLLDHHQSLPSDASTEKASHLTGKLLRFGKHEINLFQEELVSRTEAGWLPYLLLEARPRNENLLLLCDEGQTRGNYLPVDTGVQMSVQICAILSSAHALNIVYRDHKILHYYWDFTNQKISMIDWNVAKWYPEGLSGAEIQVDLVQFGARALHHILTGRPAPGALPVGPTRPDEIEMAPVHYSPAWTYDDTRRISVELRNIMSDVLSGHYTSAAQLGEDLLLQLSFSDQLKHA